MDDIWEVIFKIAEHITAATCVVIVHPDALEDIVCTYTMDGKPYLVGSVEISGVPIFDSRDANPQKAMLVSNTGETVMLDWPDRE